MPLLQIKELQAGYGGAPVLHGISMSIEEGEIVSVVGANGAGKTTLLRTISGFLEPFSGQIVFQGEPVQGFPPHRVVARGIIQVLEGRQIFNFLTVEQNLIVGSSTRMAKRQRKANFDFVYHLFPRLAERRTQMGGTLSGGEQQMLATARALMGSPKLLMLDEPSWGLAPILTQELLAAIKRISKEFGTTVMLVEQNVQKALSMADRGYVIERGCVVMEGKGPDLLGTKELKVAYLGL
jgi:branched-chain amino acid transport system ATP-binding protein